MYLHCTGTSVDVLTNPGTDSLTPTLLQLTQYWLLCSYTVLMNKHGGTCYPMTTTLKIILGGFIPC